MEGVLVPVDEQVPQPASASAASRSPKVTEGEVAVAVRHDGPLKTTLRATRAGRKSPNRDVVYAA
jgi:hemin uptake protein HemP